MPETSLARSIQIGRREIGSGQPGYVIAELSANHHQDFEQAVRIIHAAKEAGADAVKLQTYTPDTITIRSDREYFKIGGGTLWDGRTFTTSMAKPTPLGMAAQTQASRG